MPLVRKRKPAYTDRILYRCSSDNLNLKQEHYHSHPDYQQSDHKPVTTLFELDTTPHAARDISNLAYVTFLPIVNACVGRDVTVRFTYTNSNGAADTPQGLKLKLDWDWVGLFPAEFTGLDEYVDYVFVGGHCEQFFAAAAIFDEGDNAGPALSQSVVFAEILQPGRYRAVYFSGEQPTSVLGLSAPFEVTF